jgi:hypothetical protein
MNTYQGIPFICKAKVARIEGDVVILESRNPTILCLQDQKETRVLGSDYFEPSLANVVSIDVSSGTISLSDFTYSGTKLGERMLIRAQPTEAIEVQIENKSQKTIGHLVDISLSGLGVQIQDANFHHSLVKGLDIQISLQLPSGKVNTSGTITKVDRFKQDYRLSIRFAQDIADRTTIFRYLIDRRKEIEKEVEKNYAEALRSSS